TVAPALGAPPGRRALDEEELALLGVALGAVRELAREREAVERALAQHEVARLPSGFASAERGEALLHDPPRVGRVLLEVLAKGVVHRGRDLPGDLGVAEARLRLPLELRLADLHADHRGETLAHVGGREVQILLCQRAALPRVRVDGSGEHL